MTWHFLIPMDDSEQARNALRHALKLFSDAKITVVHAVDPVEAAYSGEIENGDHGSNQQDTTGTRTETVFESAQSVAEEFERTIVTTVAEGQPAEATYQVSPTTTTE